MIYFNGTEGDFDALLKAEVGHQIMLRADTAEELDSLKKATRKAAKELKMRLRFEKDEHRVELGTRPKTEGLWHNSRGHYGYARITSREVPISAPSLTRPRGGTLTTQVPTTGSETVWIWPRQEDHRMDSGLRVAEVDLGSRWCWVKVQVRPLRQRVRRQSYLEMRLGTLAEAEKFRSAGGTDLRLLRSSDDS